MKFMKDMNLFIAVCGAFVLMTAFAFNTFATIKYVDGQVAGAVSHSDQNRERMIASIDGLRRMIELALEESKEARKQRGQ